MMRLTIVSGPETGKVFTQTQDTFSIGRGEECEVVLRDSTVSRRHCTIQRSGQQQFSLSDLYTPNGTFLNDPKTRVQTRKLRNGDQIILGNSSLRVELLEEKQVAQDSDSGLDETLVLPDDRKLPKNWQSGMTVVARRPRLSSPDAAKRSSGKEQTGMLSDVKRFLTTVFSFFRR
jgi:pSer/pThr/pTyr-binding forkhead associated (FHA) protein